MFYKKYLYLQKIYYYESIKINFYLFPFLCFSNEYILVGDSQAFYLAKNTKEIKLVKKISQPGIGVEQLIQKVNNYPLSKSIKSG